MPSGGKRKGAGRPKNKIKKIVWQKTVTKEEKEKINEFLEKLREKKG